MIFPFSPNMEGAELMTGKKYGSYVYRIDIHIPAGMPHGPLNFKRVDKPVFFQYALMSGHFNIITKDGNEMWWEGPNRLCCYDKNKKCIYCNKCVGDTSNPDALGV